MQTIKKLGRLTIWLTFILLVTACGNEAPTSSPGPATEKANISPTSQSLPLSTATPSTVPAVTAPPTQTLAPTVDWQHRWLAGIPCYLPCWEGIRPGQTTAEEAVKILKQVPFTKDVKTYKNIDAIITSEIDWAWLSSKNPFGIGGNIYTINKQGVETVGQISASYEKPFTLGEIIKAYGNPTYVSAHVGIGESTTDIYAFTTELFFVKNGFSLYLSGKPKYLIDQDTLFNSITIDNYDPFNSDPQSLPQYKERTELLVPWQGYNNFDFYCRSGYGKDGKSIGDCSEIYKFAS